MASTLTPTPKHRLIAHRGASKSRPENTLESFKHAAEQGANWIEFDIQLTEDDKWVVIHDHELERTTNGSGNVKDKTLNYLMSLDAGSWFNQKYKNLKIPTLQQTIELCHSEYLYPNIEIKPNINNPEKHVDLLIKFLDNYNFNNFSMPIVSSFDFEILKLLRKKKKFLPISYLINEFNKDTYQIYTENSFTTINCNVNKLNIDNIKNSKIKNIPVLAYTVNDPKIYKYWLEQGVAAFFTDNIPELTKF